MRYVFRWPLAATIDCARCLSMAIAGQNRLYNVSIDSHPAIYASQSPILEARPKIYCGWRWLLLDTIAYPIFLFIINNCFSDDIQILSYGTQQVAKYLVCTWYQVYHVLYVCGSVNRRHHVVETIHALSHSFAEDIIFRCR